MILENVKANSVGAKDFSPPPRSKYKIKIIYTYHIFSPHHHLKVFERASPPYEKIYFHTSNLNISKTNGRIMLYNDEYYMSLAYQEALKAFDEGEVPIGAVIVKDGKVIGRGYNRIESLNDATAHAEVVAIGAASEALETWRLNECTMYVTLEPCLMCLGAMLQSRVDRIVYGASDNRMGAVETFDYKDTAAESYHRFPETLGGVMAVECRELIQGFFKNIRKK